MLPEYPISVPTYDCSDSTSYEYSQFTSAFTYNIPSVDIISLTPYDNSDSPSDDTSFPIYEFGDFLNE